MLKSIHSVSAQLDLRSVRRMDAGVRTRASNLGGIVLALVGALAATLPHSPANMPYVYPDGGVFLYVAQRLREGAVLYRDVWDHKPPLIYYLNELGLALTNGSRWGVWALELVAVGTAALTGYLVLRRAAGQLVALLVTAVWLLAFFSLVEDGNLTETFALPLQFLCLALAYDVETHRQGIYRWRGILLGALLALIFWLKPNEIGIGLAVGLYILVRAARRRSWRSALTSLALILVGFVAVSVPVLLPSALQGGLGDLYQTVFVFNYIYSRRFAFIASRVDALAAGYQFLSTTVLLVLGSFGFIIGVVALLRARGRIPASLRPLLGISALALPIEIVLVTTSGRSFDHYFIALLYVLAVWMAWFLHVAKESILLWLDSHTIQTRRWVTAGLLSGVLVLSLPALQNDIVLAEKLHAVQPSNMVAYIRSHTTPRDTVLVWGLETRLLFFADRRAPTKFPHTVIFEFPQVATADVVEDYFARILAKKPALIIDTRGYGLNNFTPAQSHKLFRQINRLRDLYHRSGEIGGMTIYERKSP